jgi:AraC-like DNA-binding protein
MKAAGFGLEGLHHLPQRRKAEPHPRAKQAQTRLSAPQVDRLIALYGAGVSISGLADEFNIHRTTVMKHVERAGAPRGRGIVLDHLGEARRLYEQGWSLAKVGLHLGVDAETVRQAFRRAGIPRRPRPGSANP